MQERTRDVLRNVAKAYLGKDDLLALEILQLICVPSSDVKEIIPVASNGAEVVHLPVDSSLSASTTADPEWLTSLIPSELNPSYRSYRQWAEIVKKSWIPLLASRQRYRFTTDEFFNWVEKNIKLSEGDRQMMSSGPRWRQLSSDGLKKLCDDGVIDRLSKGSTSFVIPEVRPHFLVTAEQAPSPA